VCHVCLCVCVCRCIYVYVYVCACVCVCAPCVCGLRLILAATQKSRWTLRRFAIYLTIWVETTRCLNLPSNNESTCLDSLTFVLHLQLRTLTTQISALLASAETSLLHERIEALSTELTTARAQMEQATQDFTDRVCECE